MQWTKNWFEEHHFEGWKPWRSLSKTDLPPLPGVYVVVGTNERPGFLVDSVGGPHKRVPLTVGVEVLNAAWTGSEVLYIGKASGREGLRNRVWAYAQQGRGNSAGHFGGRYLWQHPTSSALRVGWRTTGDLDAGSVEESLIALFVNDFGQRPFANLKGGQRFAQPEAREYLEGWL